MRYYWWLSIGTAVLGLVVASGCTYPKWAVEQNRKQAEYVEQFHGSSETIERAVRRGLTEEGFEVVGVGEPEDEPARVVRARKGPKADPSSIHVSVVVEPSGDGGRMTTLYLDANRQQEGTVDTTPIVESIEAVLEDKEIAIVRSDAPTGGGDEGRTDEGEAAEEGGESSESKFVEAVPQSSAYALVIGIGQYRDLPPPTGAAADARRMGELFKRSFGLPDDHVRTLVDDRATRTDLESALDWIANSVPDGGRIYFYYAGHGTPHPKTGSSLVLPYEASQSNLTGSGLALDDLLSRLEASGAKSVFAFVDACFSGEGGRSVTAEGQRPAVPVELVAEQQKEGRTVLYAASKADQVSGANAAKTGGLFTAHLVRALGTGEADVDGDGQVTVAELDTYVTPRVAREAEELSRRQKPDLKLGPGLEDAGSLAISWGLPVD